MVKATEKQKENMKKYALLNKIKIKIRKHKDYLKNSIRTTNKTMDLNFIDKETRKRARSYARKFKKQNCELCGIKNNLERHHWNYNKPYKTNFCFLCKDCHAIQHIKHFSSSKYGGNLQS